MNFTDSRIGRRVRLLFSVPIIRALFCEVMDLEAHSGAGIGHFVGPVAFTISRLLCCFACSLSLICRGNQPGIASSRPLSGRQVARVMSADRRVAGFVRQTPPSSYPRPKECNRSAGWHVRADILRERPTDRAGGLSQNLTMTFKKICDRTGFFKRRRSAEAAGNDGVFRRKLPLKDVVFLENSRVVARLAVVDFGHPMCYHSTLV